MFSSDEFLRHYAKYASLPDGMGNAQDFVREPVVAEVMTRHWLEIVDYKERLWETANLPDNPPYPRALVPSSTFFSQVVDGGHIAPPPHYWFHLIYAYMLEQTRIYEIFQEVISGFIHGEKLGIASPQSMRWLRTTEALFYRQQLAHDHVAPTTLTSDTRADGRAIRRNSYFRMFGMDLTHGTPDNKPYPYEKPEKANRDFVDTLVALLKELWTSIVYKVPSGANPTDEGAIRDLTQRLMVMLTDRRVNGTLKAEELSSVATMDWLRLAISTNSFVVTDLRADAGSESERLTKIGERVGVAAHAKTEDFLELAADLSQLLQGIEDRTYVDRESIQNFMGDKLERVINNWSSATGTNLKVRAPGSRQSSQAA